MFNIFRHFLFLRKDFYMVFPIIIIVATLICMLITIIFDIKIKIKNFSFSAYWFVVLLGACLLIIFGFISAESLKNVFISSSNINPLKILIIFLSCTSLSVLLDEIGFFKYIAGIAVKKAGTSQTKLFFIFSGIVAILTIFTSNDILILTFTPFICYFTKRAKIDPIPYIVSEFAMANAWSMFLFIDNPTNIYLCSIFDITFLDYVLKMFLPTIVAGVTALVIIYLLFKNKLKQKIEVEDIKIVRPEKFYLITGLCGLFFAIFFMVISSYIGIELWYIPLIASIITYTTAGVYSIIKKNNKKTVLNSLKKLPYNLIPFLLSMSVIVSTLEDVGLISKIAQSLSGKGFVLTGIISFLVGNVINNIPMTMFFVSILSNLSYTTNMVFAVVISSNLCAFLTPVGALAGIMFMNILRQNNVDFSFKKFAKYGIIVSIPTLILCLLTLFIC